MSNISITAIKVRNTDTKTDTNLLIPLTNGTLYLSEAPKNWALSVYFSSSPIVNNNDNLFGAALSVDNAPIVYQESPPFCFPNKASNLPLNLPVGEHTLTWSADGLAPQTINFTVSTSPNPNPVPPSPNITSIIGSNGDGIMSDTNYDPTINTILIKTMNALNWSIMRLWTVGTIGDGFTSDQWTLPLKWAALKIKIIAVLNFQNSKLRCQAPSDTDWVNQLNSIPPSSETGVWAFEIGNEIDTNGTATENGVYWIGGVTSYAHLLALAYPILKSKGYIVIAGNTVHGLTYYQELKPLGAFSNCDMIGRHFYNATAAENLAVIDELIAFAVTVNKGVCCTEGNIHTSDVSSVPSQIVLQKEGLAKRNGMFLIFPLVNNINGDKEDIYGPIASDFQNSAYYESYV